MKIHDCQNSRVIIVIGDSKRDKQYDNLLIVENPFGFGTDDKHHLKLTMWHYIVVNEIVAQRCLVKALIYI